MDYITRTITPPSESYFLLGPRGTGKSTWLLHQYPEAVRLDLLLGDEERRFSAYPERIRDVASAMKPGSTLIIDEIQRIPRFGSFPWLRHISPDGSPRLVYDNTPYVPR